MIKNKYTVMQTFAKNTHEIRLSAVCHFFGPVEFRTINLGFSDSDTG